MSKPSLLEKITTKDILNSNSMALESMEDYKILKDLLEQTYSALGKSNFFETTTASTSSFDIDCYAQLSTTAQKI